MESKEYLGHTVYVNGIIISKNGIQITSRLNSKGYPQVNLFFNGKNYSRRTHRILAELFIPNPYNKPHVNHKNRNRADFSIDNLEWNTPKENAVHSVINGGRLNWTRNNKGNKNPNSKINIDKSIEIKNKYFEGNISQSKLAKAYNLNQSTINKIINNKLWN